MEELTNLEKKFLKLLGHYTIQEQKEIKNAYDFAFKMHQNQKRKSGEPYIIHPLSVALILGDFIVDADTLKAGLMHDIIEDTPITAVELEKIFNSDVAFLVDGVSKLPQKLFKTKEEQQDATIRKLIEYFKKDMRVISIKLADRYHNMTTLNYLSPSKQQEKSLETLEIYAPFAYRLGAYSLEHDLEDLSLKYLKPDIYNTIKEERDNLKQKRKFVEIIEYVYQKLKEKNIIAQLQYEEKNIYGIYKRISIEPNIKQIPDLFSFKIIVKTKKECYEALKLIHELFQVVQIYEHDFIKNPKPNLYQSRDTTILLPDGQMIQFLIRTNQMNIQSMNGLIGYGAIYGKEARQKMQQDIQLCGIEKLWELDNKITSNQEFIRKLKKTL